MKPSGWIHENDKKNVLNTTGLILGCAMAGLDIVQAAYYKKQFSFINQAWKALNQGFLFVAPKLDKPSTIAICF